MARDAQVSIIVKLIDKASKQIDGISNSAKRMGKSMKQTGKQMTRDITLPLAAIGVASLKAASDLDRAMRDIQSITGQTDDEIQQLQETMIELSTSMDTGAFSAEQYARAQYDVNSAGFEGAEALDILEVSSRAATAGQADLAAATDVTLSTLKAYNLEASEATRVNDLLFTGVRIGKQTYEQLATGVKNTGPAFAAFNIPVSDSIAALTLFSNKGVDAANAATRMNAIIFELNAPTAELAELIQKAGFESGRAMLQTLGFTGTMEKLNSVAKQEGVILSDTMSQRRAAMGIMTLTGDNMNELIDIQNELNNSSGDLNAAFAEQSKSFDFQFKKMVASLQEVAVIIGNELIPMLMPLIDWIKQAAENFSNLDGTTKKWIVGIGLLVAVLGPLLILFGSIIGAIGTIGSAITAVAGAMGLYTAGTTAAAGATTALAIPLSAILIPIAAVAAAIGGLILFGPKIVEFGQQVLSGLGDLATGIGKGIGDTIKGAGKAIGNFFGIGGGGGGESTVPGMAAKGLQSIGNIFSVKNGETIGTNFGTGMSAGMAGGVVQGISAVGQMLKQTAQGVSNFAQQTSQALQQAVAPAARAMGVPQQKGKVHTMSIRRGAGPFRFKGDDIAAQAEATRQQLMSMQPAAGFGGFSPFQQLPMGQQISQTLGSPDISQSEKDSILAALGGGGGGGDINIHIDTINAPGMEDVVDATVKRLEKELKQRNLTGA
jgi:TP901 family phage tail tape measure protein